MQRFFDSIQNQNYEDAYACLSDYASLGLEKEPEGANAQIIYQALRDSYGYTLYESSVNGLDAVQRVSLLALNLHRTENAVQQQVNTVLEEMVAQLPQSEVYDENGGYLTSLTDAVYTEALARALENKEDLCTVTDFDIRLKYNNGTWKMLTDRTLMTALVGGAG